MGRKVNPIGFRLPVRRDWKSRWYAKGRRFTDLVIKDAGARRMIERDYRTAMISRVEIEQKIGSIRLIIHAARPGVVIGKKGEGIDKLRAKLRRLFASNEVLVDVQEVEQPDADAKVIALNIADQLEKRVMFRRAMRRALTNAMRLKIEGIKIMSAGRLNGIEIARTEWYREGRVPLHTLKNDIDYGFAEANTAMGVIGVKVWVSKGDTYGVRKKAKWTIDGTEEGGGGKAVAVGDESRGRGKESASEAPVAKKTVVTKAAAKTGDGGDGKGGDKVKVIRKAAKSAPKSAAAKKADEALDTEGAEGADATGGDES